MKLHGPGEVEPGPLRLPDGGHTVPGVAQIGMFRYHLTVLPTRPGDGSDDEPTKRPGSHRVGDGDDGWELVRSHVTKDDVSTLLLYRKPA